MTRPVFFLDLFQQLLTGSLGPVKPVAGSDANTKSSATVVLTAARCSPYVEYRNLKAKYGMLIGSTTHKQFLLLPGELNRWWCLRDQ